MASSSFAAKNGSENIDPDILFDHHGAAARGSNIFGLLATPEEAKILLHPVPWEATVSYGGGAAEGPEAILKASTQIDLYDSDLGSLYRLPVAMLPELPDVRRWNKDARKHAAKVTVKGYVDDSNRKDAEEVNALSEKMNVLVEGRTKEVLEQGKIPGLVGGDHSTPLGAIRAVAHAHGEIGVLHVDAHCDLRGPFEGFTYSHGSIMRHVVGVPGVATLVQVGIRDFCRWDREAIEQSKGRIQTFFDEDCAARMAKGMSWSDLCAEIVGKLPKKVYISFDIDGLEPSLCPHTGTPVPGGLTWNQALLLLKTVVKAGKSIVGFDLVEVAPGPEGEWDANVGARLLLKLCGWTLKSQGKV